MNNSRLTYFNIILRSMSHFTLLYIYIFIPISLVIYLETRMSTLFEQSLSHNTRCFACGSLVYAVEKKLTTNHVNSFVLLIKK